MGPRRGGAPKSGVVLDEGKLTEKRVPLFVVYKMLFRDTTYKVVLLLR